MKPLNADNVESGLIFLREKILNTKKNQKKNDFYRK